jgi:hypothetical protein
MEMQFTNELNQELLDVINASPFTAEKLAEMDESVRAVVEEQAAFARQHPVIAIYRLATLGSLTARGGKLTKASSTGDVTLGDGMEATFAVEQDEVTYADGSTAKIVTSAGHQFCNGNRGFALVGSVLDNGDKIISTPQGSFYLVARQGIPMAEDFLAVTGA